MNKLIVRKERTEFLTYFIISFIEELETKFRHNIKTKRFITDGTF